MDRTANSIDPNQAGLTWVCTIFPCTLLLLFLWYNQIKKNQIKTYNLSQVLFSTSTALHINETRHVSKVHKCPYTLLFAHIATTSGCINCNIWMHKLQQLFFECSTWSVIPVDLLCPIQGITQSIALVKALFFQSKSIDIFSYFSIKTRCGYSLEAPQWCASTEYPQHMFSWRNKKNINRHF